MAYLDYDGLLYFWQKLKAKLAGKVDKVDGKQLSTNDYTTAEKNKLAGLSNYTHPTSSGNKHIPAGGASGQVLGWASDGTAQWVNDKNTTYSAFKGATADAAGGSGLVPGPAAGKQGQYLRGDGTWATPTNTTYGAASQSTAGLMSAADKKKLDGIASGANAYTHPTSAGNKHIPAGGASGQILRWGGDGLAVWGADKDTTYSAMTGATTDAAGKSGLVPAPGAGAATRYLRSDGTWVTPPNTWRGIQDNLTSDSASDSLSAKQGKALKALVDGKAAASHTHTKSQITDFPTSMPASDVKAWAKADTKPAYSWNEINSKPTTFAPSAHTHDDRYYTETEMNGKLANKAQNVALDAAIDLNTVTTPGFYSCGGSNTAVNKPNNIDAFGLIVTHNASSNFYTQMLLNSTSTAVYRRICNNGTWTAWVQDKYTDTNTWRGIQNNLTSDSTTDSLSAAQGKALKGLIDGKAAASHTHNYAGSSSAGGAANSANKLNTNAGTATQPVYFKDGVPVATTYGLNKTVPADAKFTDTTYSAFKAATSSAAGGAGLVPAPAAGKQGQYLRGDGTWATPTNTTYSDATQSTHGLMSVNDKKKLDAFSSAGSYALKTDITAMYRYKGTVESVDKLPTTGQTVGDVYDVGDGMNYAWNGEKWDGLGQVFTIEKIKNTEIDTVLAS